jgi:hypothetical protein
MGATTQVFEHHFLSERCGAEVAKVCADLERGRNAGVETFDVRDGAIDWAHTRPKRDYGHAPFAPHLGNRSGTLIRICYQSSLGSPFNEQGRAEIAEEVARDQLESRRNLGALRLSLDFLEGRL